MEAAVQYPYPWFASAYPDPMSRRRSDSSRCAFLAICACATCARTSSESEFRSMSTWGLNLNPKYSFFVSSNRSATA